jgi:hypothetical protein
LIIFLISIVKLYEQREHGHRHSGHEQEEFNIKFSGPTQRSGANQLYEERHKPERVDKAVATQ